MVLSAGLLTFFSPCVIPFIPAYVCYLTGSIIPEINPANAKLNVIIRSVAFVLGFTFVFIIIGASVSILGDLFLKNIDLIRKIGGGLIILLGLHTAGLFRLKILYYDKQLIPIGSHHKRLGAFYWGMAFATVWTPCVGPILASIFKYTGNMLTMGRAILLLLLYAFGLAIPFLLTALAIGSLSHYLGNYHKYFPAFSAFSGILLIVWGIFVIMDKLSALSRYFI
ncbi:cytochrome c biogenesis protein CcdA [Clostridium sp. BNL1100]|uniref:cytochrome c biogenesis protein CcdA n=1 Tax=Clostridium sp. BNL1100 TaxID=755731 RepID=UPI00024A753F|nr:cytochrome c biogenesis protein CcdA [Clostridium sp. BNL1100]AEY67307.1 cytochrome c biogenesis protein [Clostridium sp. BNL1100]